MAGRQHVIPLARIYDGEDCLRLLGSELTRLGCRRAAIFCGATLAGGSSPLGLVKAALGDALVGVFDGAKAHSPLPAVEAGADFLRQVEADAVIAVGGGSAMVTARAASILLAEGRSAHDLCTTRDGTGKLKSPRLLAPKLPQLVVPTTPTTAVSKAGSAVLDPVTRSRLALFDPKTRAVAVFVHSALLGSASRSLLIDASLNSFCSAVEGLMSGGGDPLSDAYLMHAVRLYAQHLASSDALDSPAIRSDLLYAAFMSGSGTDHTAAGVMTALAHAVAAHCGVDSGLAKMILLPHAIAFNAAFARPGLDKLATAFGVPAGGNGDHAKVSEAIAAVTKSLGLAGRLSDAGVDRKAFDAIAEKSMADWFLSGNPRPVRDPQDLLQVLEAAW